VPRAPLAREAPSPEVAARADALLHEVLDNNQRQELADTGIVTVRGSLGGEYRIKLGRSGNVTRVVNGEAVERLCIHPNIDVPDADVVVSQVLMLRTNEAAFLVTANHYDLIRQEGIGYQERMEAEREDLEQQGARWFFQELARRREAGHNLRAQDDPMRLLRGFVDHDTGEWLLIPLRRLRDVTLEDAEALGLTGVAELADVLRVGLTPLLRQEPTVGDVIDVSLRTMMGRDALAAALMARIRWGGAPTPAVTAEIAAIARRVFAAGGGPAMDQVRLGEWLDAYDAAQGVAHAG